MSAWSQTRTVLSTEPANILHGAGRADASSHEIGRGWASRTPTEAITPITGFKPDKHANASLYMKWILILTLSWTNPSITAAGYFDSKEECDVVGSLWYSKEQGPLSFRHGYYCLPAKGLTAAPLP